MPHPPAVAARIDRLCAFHEGTKGAAASGEAPQRPSLFRVFTGHLRIQLPTRLLDAPANALQAIALGVGCLPESLVHPPQDLKTLASWLHLAAGITGKVTRDQHVVHLRSCPSAGGLYSCELYVLALAIEGLTAGLYHFSPKDFSLYQLRDGWEALAQLKRGRPDLEMLKSMPAIALVSTIPWRSVWRYGRRGNRYATLDAGHMVENLVQGATGLGMQSLVRLHLNDKNTRELIGISADCRFDEYEVVQAAVAWADAADHPIPAPEKRTPPVSLKPIARPPLSSACVDHPLVRKAHEDCVAPGVGVVEVRPPHTETCPLPAGTGHNPIAAEAVNSDVSIMRAMSTRRSCREFLTNGISRPQFARLNALAFRSGAYHPIVPDGAHMGLIRPFWFVHGVAGMTPGLYYYHANIDQFSLIRAGDLRFECKYLFADQEFCGQASATCVMVANLRGGMDNSSPDAYRLAHLEAGVAGGRLYLACTAMHIDCCAAGHFLDDEMARALGLNTPNWQCLYGFAVGSARPQSS